MTDIAGSKFTRSLMGKIAYWAKMLNDYSEQGSLTISGDDLVSLAYTFAALAAPVDADVEELAANLENCMQIRYLRDGYPHVIDVGERAAATLRRLSRENVALREGVERAEMQAFGDGWLSRYLDNYASWRGAWNAYREYHDSFMKRAALREGVEKVRAEIEGELTGGDPDDAWVDGMIRALAILDQHFPKPEGER